MSSQNPNSKRQVKLSKKNSRKEDEEKEGYRITLKFNLRHIITNQCTSSENIKFNACHKNHKHYKTSVESCNSHIHIMHFCLFLCSSIFFLLMMNVEIKEQQNKRTFELRVFFFVFRFFFILCLMRNVKNLTTHQQKDIQRKNVTKNSKQKR